MTDAVAVEQVGPHGGVPPRIAGTPLDQASYALVMVHGRGGSAEGMWPIARAAKATDAALVAPLLKSKANTELQNEDGSTPLGIAVRQGDLPLTSLLLDAGADRNAEWIRGADVTPLIVLAAEMSNEVTKALVNAGAAALALDFKV